MSEVKLVQIPTITSQGVSFKFSGLPHFNDKWFSWAAICKAVLHREDEVEIDSKCSMPKVDGTQISLQKVLTVLKNKTYDSNMGRGKILSCGHTWPCNCSDKAAKELIKELEEVFK